MSLKDQYKKILDILKSQAIEMEKVKISLTQLHETFIENLKNAQKTKNERLEENENRIKKIKAFISLAQAHTSHLFESNNALIFDNVKLVSLAVQINNASYNDIFAQKLYTEATGQLKYLNSCINHINHNYDHECYLLKKEYDNQKQMLKNKQSNIIFMQQVLCTSKDFTYLIELLKQSNDLFNTNHETEMNQQSDSIHIGIVKEKLPIFEECKDMLKTSLQPYYDDLSSEISLPYHIDNHSNKVFSIEYSNENESILLKGIQNYILNILKHCPNLYENICMMDPVRYNNSALGCLGKIAKNDTGLIDRVPLSMEEIRTKVHSLMMDIHHQEMGTIRTDKKKLLIFHNFPQAYESSLVSQIQQLCVNADRYKLTIITTHNHSIKNIFSSDVLNYINSIACKMITNQDKFYVIEEGLFKEFHWYQAPEKLPNYILKKYEENKLDLNKSNIYMDRVGFKTTIHEKGVRRIENIPFSVDTNGNLQYIDFEDSNFATFICGASRSGKSTLLHTILTGIMKQTHPDDVEIWLIDFKMTEFSRYIENLPPHIRYILLDESPELVYDILDRLTEILVKRQNIFKGKWQKLDEVPKDKYMPELFVVIDEFSVMSQIIADSVTTGENYIAKLQTLLAKGAALGMHFIFASQGFTSGTRGLNDFSKKQIQQRIAMKTEFNEIKETLDLKSASDEDKLMMEQLPVYHTLVRKPMDIKGNHLAFSKVLYIDDYLEQEKMIRQMNEEYIIGKKYDVNHLKEYIHKKPMIIDGNCYSSFYEHKDEIKEKLRELDLNDEIALFTGQPRRMVPHYPICINQGFCENILLVASMAEIEPAASVVLSSMESLKLQNIDYSILGLNKNSIFKHIKDDSSNMNTSLELNQVCKQIKKIKQDILDKKETNQVIFIFGLDTLMLDMSFQQKESKLSSVSIEKRSEDEMDLDTLLASLKNKTIETNQPKNSSRIENVELVNAYDAREDLKYIFTHGPRLGYHFFVVFSGAAELMQCKLDLTLFKHKMLFRMAKTDSINIIGSAGSKVISELADHSYRYTNGLESVSFRPYLHTSLSWDGWKIENGVVSNVTDEEEEYLL